MAIDGSASDHQLLLFGHAVTYPRQQPRFVLITSTELPGILDRQFKLVSEAKDHRTCLHRLAALIDFLDQEPTVAPLMVEIGQDAERLEADLKALEAAIAPKAIALIKKYQADGGRWPRQGRSLDNLVDELSRGSTWSPGIHGDIWPALQSFRNNAAAMSSGSDPNPYRDLLAQFTELTERVEHNERRYTQQKETHAGFALQRIREVLWKCNPPAMKADSLDRMRLFGDTTMSTLFGDGSDHSLGKLLAFLLPYVGLLREELQLRLFQGRSRIYIVRRFASRCEQYDAERLRAVASKPAQAEAELTKEFARYLFDQGFNVLMDPKVAGLRPDVYQAIAGDPFYVEAKQYAEDTKAIAKMVQKAVAQMLDTWGRLAQTDDVREGFLLIFRRGGPRVELPELLRFNGKHLYLVVADIAPAAESGSKQKLKPILLSPEQLLPKAAE